MEAREKHISTDNKEAKGFSTDLFGDREEWPWWAEVVKKCCFGIVGLRPLWDRSPHVSRDQKAGSDTE